MNLAFSTRSRSQLTTAVGVGAAMLLAASQGLAQTQYRLVDLGILNGESHAFGVKDASLALGSATNSFSNFRAVTLGDGASPSPLLDNSTFHQAVAFCIDGADRIIGTTYDLGALRPTAFRIESGAGVSLGQFAARACNSAGVIAGTTQVSVNGVGAGMVVPQAIRYDNGTLTTLGTLGGLTSQGLGIDDAGRVVGSASQSLDNGSKPCMWAPGSTTATNLGTIGGAWGQATAIRNNKIIGESMNSAGVMRATLWTLNGTGGVASVTDLGALSVTNSSYGKSINATGVCVGTSDFHAVRYMNGQVTDLNTMISTPHDNWTLEVAWAISDQGVIVGSGSRLGFPRAFMLVPCDGSCGPTCDGIDFNNDTSLFDPQDIDAFLSVYSEGPCIPATATCNDIDFNNDGSVFDPCDIDAFLLVFSEGPCTACGM